MLTLIVLVVFIMSMVFIFSSLGYLVSLYKKDEERKQRNIKRIWISLLILVLSLLATHFLPEDSLQTEEAQEQASISQSVTNHHESRSVDQESVGSLEKPNVQSKIKATGDVSKGTEPASKTKPSKQDQRVVKIEPSKTSEQKKAEEKTPHDEDSYPALDVPLDREYLEVNGNRPFFTNEDLEEVEPYHQNGSLDHLGRVTAANALLSEELMPAEERGSIRHIYPTGWKQKRYAGISNGGWLYNRSHLIGHQLTGNDEEENLMTGTRWFNETMIPFENYVANYVEEGGLVRYRVTPVFEGDNLLASGVYMEGWSVDDGGESLCFNIYIPNRQEGVSLDYKDGSSRGPLGPVQDEDKLAPPLSKQDDQSSGQNMSDDRPLIKGNISPSGEKIYHVPGQQFYEQTKIDESKGERWFYTEEEAQEAGWRRSKR